MVPRAAKETVRVGIVGGGAAGIVSAKCLKEAGHDVVVFEKSAHLGGIWKYEEKPGGDSAMYKSLHTNLPTAVMQLPDFPYPSDIRSYPSHADVLTYLENYAKHFHVDHLVRFRTRVLSVNKDDTGSKWKLQLDSNDDGNYEETVDKLVICNGHFSKPLYAPLEGIGHFKGTTVHSHEYRTPDPYVGKSVLVIGKGPSGHDISLELARNHASQVYVSYKEYDPEVDAPHIKPSYEPRTLKPVIDCIQKDGSIRFADGSVLDPAPDVIIYATGYLYSLGNLAPEKLLYPSLPVPTSSDKIDSETLKELDRVSRNNMAVAPLYKHLVSIEDPSVAFVGLCVKVLQFPLFEMQSKWLACLFADEISLPSKDVMYDDFFERIKKSVYPMRLFHHLGANLMEEYLSELGDECKYPWSTLLQRIFVDAAILRRDNPFDYRSAEYVKDDSTGEYVRKFCPKTGTGDKENEMQVKTIDGN